jgi:ATP-dependent Clp protease, protease subunit
MEDTRMARLNGALELNVDWKSRTIYVIGQIDDGKSLKIIPAIRIMDESKGPIKVLISSPGGEETAGFAIYDALKLAKNPVKTFGFGGIYSIAALIFQAGTTRALAPNSQLMMHNGILGLEHNHIDSDKVVQLSREVTQNNHRYHSVIASRSESSLDTVQRWCREERYFLPEEAFEENLTDLVLKDWRAL